MKIWAQFFLLVVLVVILAFGMIMLFKAKPEPFVSDDSKCMTSQDIPSECDDRNFMTSQDIPSGSASYSPLQVVQPVGYQPEATSQSYDVRDPARIYFTDDIQGCDAKQMMRSYTWWSMNCNVTGNMVLANNGLLCSYDIPDWYMYVHENQPSLTVTPSLSKDRGDPRDWFSVYQPNYLGCNLVQNGDHPLLENVRLSPDRKNYFANVKTTSINAIVPLMCPNGFAPETPPALPQELFLVMCGVRKNQTTKIMRGNEQLTLTQADMSMLKKFFIESRELGVAQETITLKPQNVAVQVYQYMKDLCGTRFLYEKIPAYIMFTSSHVLKTTSIQEPMMMGTRADLRLRLDNMDMRFAELDTQSHALDLKLADDLDKIDQWYASSKLLQDEQKTRRDVQIEETYKKKQRGRSKSIRPRSKSNRGRSKSNRGRSQSRNSTSIFGWMKKNPKRNKTKEDALYESNQQYERELRALASQFALSRSNVTIAIQSQKDDVERRRTELKEMIPRMEEKINDMNTRHLRHIQNSIHERAFTVVPDTLSDPRYKTALDMYSMDDMDRITGDINETNLCLYIRMDAP